MAILRQRFPTRFLIVVILLGLGGGAAFIGRQLLTGGGPGGVALDDEGLPRGPVSYDLVKSRPEAHLYYPGSRILSTMGGSEDTNPLQPNPAFAGTILTTTDSADTVDAWYRQKLSRESPPWQPYDIPSLTTQISAQGFRRGSRERFSVGIDDRKLLAETLGRQVPTGGTVFEIDLLIFPNRH